MRPEFGLIIGFIFSLIVAGLILFQNRKEGLSFGSVMAVIVLVFPPTILSFTLLSVEMKNLYRYVAAPSYQATIVDLDVTEIVDDAKIKKMYRKIYHFTDSDNQPHTLSSPLASAGQAPIIGSQEKIIYSDGVLLEASSSGVLMDLWGALFMLLILVFPFYLLFNAFKLQKATDLISTIGAALLFRVIIPAGLATLVGLIVYQNFWRVFSRNDVDADPLAMVISIVIIIALLMGLKVSIEIAWGENITRRAVRFVQKKYR